MSVWENFTGIDDATRVNEIKRQMSPLDVGTYEMTLEKIEPSMSQANLPKIAGQFRMDTNRVVFYNQSLQVLGNQDLTDKNIADGVQFVEALLGYEIDYRGILAFQDSINEANETCVGKRYLVSVSYAKSDKVKKYPKLKIVKEIVNLDDFEPMDGDGDIPL